MEVGREDARVRSEWEREGLGRKAKERRRCEQERRVAEQEAAAEAARMQHATRPIRRTRM